MHNETSAHPAGSNRGPSQASLHGSSVTRTFHTLAMNNTYFRLQQQSCLKSSLATDGSTLLTGTSKSVTTSDSSDKDSEIDVQVNSASASSNDSDTSGWQKNAKKIDNASRVGFFHILLFNAS